MESIAQICSPIGLWVIADWPFKVHFWAAPIHFGLEKRVLESKKHYNAFNIVTNWGVDLCTCISWSL